MVVAVVRSAVPADAVAVRGVVRDAFSMYVARIGRRPAPMDQDYAQVLSESESWVAVLDGEVVGVLVTCPGAGHLLVETLAVRPDAQGHGIGARLLGIAEDAAIGAGLGEVRLYTNEAMSENLEFYPRHGYVESHRRVVDGFRRVFFAKTLGGPGGLTAG